MAAREGIVEGGLDVVKMRKVIERVVLETCGASNVVGDVADEIYKDGFRAGRVGASKDAVRNGGTSLLH